MRSMRVINKHLADAKQGLDLSEGNKMKCKLTTEPGTGTTLAYLGDIIIRAPYDISIHLQPVPLNSRVELSFDFGPYDPESLMTKEADLRVLNGKALEDLRLNMFRDPCSRIVDLKSIMTGESKPPFLTCQVTALCDVYEVHWDCADD